MWPDLKSRPGKPGAFAELTNLGEQERVEVLTPLPPPARALL